VDTDGEGRGGTTAAAASVSDLVATINQSRIPEAAPARRTTTAARDREGRTDARDRGGDATRTSVARRARDRALRGNRRDVARGAAMGVGRLRRASSLCRIRDTKRADSPFPSTGFTPRASTAV
jgi:hypothetical protein